MLLSHDRIQKREPYILFYVSETKKIIEMDECQFFFINFIFIFIKVNMNTKVG